jgi:hypothetical protein
MNDIWRSGQFTRDLWQTLIFLYSYLNLSLLLQSSTRYGVCVVTTYPSPCPCDIFGAQRGTFDASTRLRGHGSASSAGRPRAKASFLVSGYLPAIRYLCPAGASYWCHECPPTPVDSVHPYTGQWNARASDCVAYSSRRSLWSCIE